MAKERNPNRAERRKKSNLQPSSSSDFSETTDINDPGTPPADKPNMKKKDLATVEDEVWSTSDLVVKMRKTFGLRSEDAINIIQTVLNYRLARINLGMNLPPPAPQPEEPEETPDAAKEAV